MKVLIYGAGSVGSVVGGFLAKAGHDVTLVGRAGHLDAIARAGLRISGIWGEHRIQRLNTATSLDAVSGPFDFIVVAVKSYDTRAAAESLQSFVAPETLVCSYQNGLGNAEVLAEVLGWHHVLDARVIYGVWLPEPGHAQVTVTADATAIGCYRDAVPMERIEVIARAMNSAGIPTHATDRIATFLWAKVAYNCALNPLSALLDVPYGGLLDTEDTKAVMREVVAELYAVGRAEGVALDPATAEDYVARLFGRLIPVTAGHYASMHEDFRRKRRTEIDALNGAIARLGAARSLACPTNETLTRLVHAKEHRYLRESTSS
jgi:2-dehydropantoate 2-reductase